MGTVVAIGEAAAVMGFALAGARVIAAATPAAVAEAWRSLDDDVSLVILTPAADRAVRAQREAGTGPHVSPLTVVTP